MPFAGARNAANLFQGIGLVEEYLLFCPASMIAQAIPAPTQDEGPKQIFAQLDLVSTLIALKAEYHAALLLCPALSTARHMFSSEASV